MQDFELYVIDTETTGLIPAQNEPIEISIYRLSNDEQKSWLLRPINFDYISEDALRVNKHKLEDLKGLTKKGQEIYSDPKKVLVEIENWLINDMVDAGSRIIVAHNALFDKQMLQELWNKCGAAETFPFNDRFVLDTMQIAFMDDFISDKKSEGYSLFAQTKKYGIKNVEAHNAASDVRATVALFRKQLETLRQRLKE